LRVIVDSSVLVAALGRNSRVRRLLFRQGLEWVVPLEVRLEVLDRIDDLARGLGARPQDARLFILEILGQTRLPQYQDWRLNERHYGQLQGVNKAEEAVRVGEQQVWRWRRGYEDQAAPLSRNDPTHPVNDPLYRDIDPALLPDVENLAETRARVMQFWRERVAPRIRLGERVLISSHGNTLRALIMGLANLSITQVESFEIPTGKPILYTFNRDAEPLRWRYL